jgi:hypothetical protein
MANIPKIPGLDKVASGVAKLWKDWIDATREKRLTWDQSLKHYGQTQVDAGDYKDYPWRCRETRPVCQEIGDTVSSAVKNSLFPANDDYFEVKGVDRRGKLHAGIVQRYLKQRLFLSRFVSRTEPFIKQVCLLGNSTAGITMEQKKIKRRRWQDFKVVEEDIPVRDYPVFKNHDIFSVAFDPELDEYDQSTTRIQRTVTNLDALKAKSNLFFNLNKIKPSGRALNDSTDSNKQNRRSRFGINEKLSLRDNEIELLTLFGDIKAGKKLHTDQLVVVANRSVPIRFEAIPFFSGNPHVFAKYSSFPGEMFGRGVIEPIIGLQRLIDTFSCQKADLINLIIGGFWAVNPDHLLDISNLTTRPHGFIFMEDVNQIRSILPTANPTLAFAEINDLRNETERSSGASKFAQGVVAGGRRTATEALATSQGSNNRFNDVITIIGEEAIEPALNIFLQQDFQFNAFQPDPFTGEEILPPEAWSGRYHVEFNGAKQSAVREITTQVLLQFMGIISSSPVFAGSINPAGFIREIAKVMNIDAEKVIDLNRLINNGTTQPLGGGQPQGQDGNIPNQIVNGLEGGGFG